MEQFILRDTLIYLDDHSFNPIEKWIQSNNFDKIFIIVDENTHFHCLPILVKHVQLLKHSFIIKISSGEPSKSMKKVQSICSYLINKHITRQSLIINLGG